MYLKTLLLSFLSYTFAITRVSSEFIIAQKHDGFMKLDFFEAFTFCEEQNYTLATPNTEEVATSFSQFLVDHSIIYAWTALADHNESGVYKWYTTGKDATYTNWHKDEPDTNGGKKLCVQQDFRGFTQGWSAADCTVKVYAICQLAEPEF